MCSPAHSHYPSRPLSTITRPPASDEPRLTRKYSLDHGEWKLPPSTPSPPARHKDLPLPPMGDLAQVTNMQTEDRPPGGESACLPTDREEEEDVNHNGPCVGTRTRGRRQVLKKQASFESIGCDDNYFYDFFDRNCRPPTPSLPTSDVLRDTSLPPLDSEVSKDLNVENNNEPINTNRLESNPGASSKLRRNVNSVRPRSWLTASTARVEDGKKARRRQTDPCGKDFLSNYEKALSSLLYQPYECRSEGPSATTSTYDDSDVGYWLGGASSKKYGERERRSAGECCSYQNESSDCSSSSASSSSSSLAGYIRRKPWGDCKDPSSSSIRALLTDWRTGNAGSASASAEAGDLEASLPREPLVALPTGCRAAPCQSAPGDGREMVATGDLIGSGSGSAPADPVDAEGVSVNSCYRAVPATVSAVPVIPCNNNVSNVRIVQTTRTFTSTEAQTDDVIVDAIRVPPGPSGVNPNREQRRRERRERRHQRRMVNHLHQTPDPAMWQAPLGEPMVDRLPDILNSHLPPPYTTLPLGLPPPQGHMHPPPPLPPTMPPPMAVPTVAGSPTAQPGGLRFPFAIVPAGRRRSRLSPHFTPEDEPKSCCGVAVSQTVSIRWFIVLIFLVGLCCAVVGTVLGAMKASGRDHLTVSLLMIGVGIVLVAVSAVAWRLTSQDAPSCRAMLGLGSDDSGGEPNRRFVPRLPPSYGRPHHPYAAMMYPEFQYRAPPPSYQASMQEYRLRLLLLDRHSGASPAAAVSPPPTYRSQAGSLLRAPIAFRGRDTLTPSQSEYSRPPSYRSRTSSRPDPPSSHSHSREPSGSDPGQAINVITVHPQHIIKLAPSPPLPAKNGKEHLVTIVQTAAEPSGPVIVTISGQHDMPSTTHCPESEMEILAHL